MPVKGKSHLILKTGPAGSGKTHDCLEAFAQEMRRSCDLAHHRTLFILPTVEQRERITDLLLRRSVPGFFGRPITTFDEVLQSFLKVGDIQFASDVTRYLLLKTQIQEMTFDYFQAAAQTKGFVDLASKTIAELKEALITPSVFEALAQKLEQSFPYFRKKYQELKMLYSGYEKKLIKSGLKDRRDALFLLEEGLQAGQWHMPRFKQVWIDGFFEFSKLQFAFIEFMTKHTDRITVTLTLESNEARKSLFKISRETRKKLLKLGFVEENQSPQNHRTQIRTLIHLSTHLFEEETKEPVPPDENVRIFEATGMRGELEMIARDIKQLMRQHSYYPSDIALLFRRLRPYLGLIRTVFNQYQIPVEVHEREELKLNPLARTLVSLLKIFHGGWNRIDVLNFLKSSFIQKEFDTVCEIELTAIREGILNGRERWCERFRQPLIQKLEMIEDEYRKQKTLEDLIQTTKKAISEFGLSDLPDRMDDQTRRNHAALGRLMLLLDEIQKKYQETNLNFETYTEILLRLIEVDLFSFHDRDRNKVQVYNISLARQKEYKVVYLPGLLEKQFPVQVRENPILSDEERRIMNASGELLHEMLPRQAIERFLFYVGVTRPRERLILSYPRFDLEGKEALPSFYVDEVKRLFSQPLVTKKQPIEEILPDLDSVATSHELHAHLIQHFWQTSFSEESPTADSLYISLYNSVLNHASLRNRIDLLLNPIEGRIQDERAKAYFLPKHGTFTPTRIEMYAECAYRYFADQILHLETDDEKIDPRVIGSVLHDVLECLHRWMKEKGSENLSIEAIQEKSAKLLEASLKKNPLSGERWYRIELKKKEIKHLLDRVIYLEFYKMKSPLPNLRPAYFEYEFGKDGKENFLEIPLKGRFVRFRGKIDRIDVDESGQYALVIDYKTGKSFKGAALKEGTELQLPLYVMAMEKCLGLKPLGAHLYQLKSGKSTGFHHKDHLNKVGIETSKRNKMESAEWQRVFERVVQYLEWFTDGILNAEIAVRPRDCVKFCSFASVCRIEKWRLDYIYKENKVMEEKRLVLEAKT